ncbi:MAG: hypothetical protein IKG85_07255 [Clostridia bacterium]|nr:hypothetical protein [Clostridia bacterium]
MDISNVIGEQIKHKAFGLGTIESISGKIITANFDGIPKKLDISAIISGGFAIFESQETADILSEYALEIEKEKARTAVPNPAPSTPSAPVKKSTYKSKGTHGIWIKFEGQQNENHTANLHKVVLNGKTLYVLNYTNSKKPSGVREDDEFFMAEGITDYYGKPCQVITGRGHLCAFSDDNVSPESWYTAHPWMKDRKWYVIIKDFEALDTNIKNGLLLNDVISHCGTETYESSSGKGRDDSYVKRMHTQKIHMRLTEEACNYINSEFDRLKRKYGSKEYLSEL